MTERENDRGGWWVAGQVVAIGLLVWGLVAGGPEVASGTAKTVLWFVGVSLLHGAGALAYGGARALGRNLTPFPEPVSGGSLVEHGVYRLVRHPLYGAVVLLGAGLAAFGNGWWAWPAVVVLAGFFTVKATFEERRLVRRFPGYADYQQRVPRRLIPWVL